MKLSHSSIMLPGAIAILLFVAQSKAQEPAKIREDAGTTVWRINRPEVRQRITSYPSVVFREFDEVTVRGGGCVNVGNGSLKPYVDPSGPDSGRLYHGRISIPGATAGLVRISSVIDKRLIVRLPVDYERITRLIPSLSLQLGYEDDYHPDNDYNLTVVGAGSDDRCRADNGGVPAWVEITLIHHDRTTVPLGPATAKSFDLWWARTDFNFLPVNPMWAGQLVFSPPGSGPPWRIKGQTILNARDLCGNFLNYHTNQFSKQCTTWTPDVDEPARFRKGICKQDRNHPKNSVHGHVNWSPATYTGKIYFLDYEAPKPLDHDYDMELLPYDDTGQDLSRAVVTAGNLHVTGKEPITLKGGLLLEFNADETIEKFTGAPTWWMEFKKKVDQDAGVRNLRRAFSKKYPVARQFVNGQDAVAIGLLGIDNQHDAHTELHPVYGLAIKTKEDQDQEVWAVFARNWGNEGECARDDGQYLHLKSLSFHMPYSIRGGGDATTLSVASRTKLFMGPSSTGENVADMIASENLRDGVVVTIPVGDPESKKFVFGEVHLKKERADLQVKIDGSPDRVETGKPIVYNIIITNRGPDTARFVKLEDELPGSTVFESCEATGGGVCSGDGPNRAVMFDKIPAGSSVIVTLRAPTLCSLRDGASIANTASVISPTTDPNSSNNSATANTAVFNPPPVIVPPQSLTVYTGPDATTCGAVIKDLGKLQRLNDNCPGLPAPAIDGIPPDHLFPVGQTTVTYTATDSGGASASATQTITVIDNTPPVITASPLTVYTGPGSTTAGVVLTEDALGVKVTDNCPGATLTKTSGIPDGRLFPIGTTKLIHEARDAHGNTAVAIQPVTVIDNTPPLITDVSVDRTEIQPAGNSMAPVTLNYKVTDNCPLPAGAVTISIASSEPDQPGNAAGQADWRVLDGNHILLRARSRGNKGRVYTITITCKDAAGNVSSAQATVSVKGRPR